MPEVSMAYHLMGRTAVDACSETVSDCPGQEMGLDDLVSDPGASIPLPQPAVRS